MEKVALNVGLRKVPGGAGLMRRHGMIPGVVYGKKEKPILIEIAESVFNRAYDNAGESTIVDLQIDQGVTSPVLIKDVQLDPVTDRAIHVDFIRLDMMQEIETTIQLVIVGVSPCVKDSGGILVSSHDELEVKCLPTDLVSEIEVDISTLGQFGDAIHISDIKLPKGITVLDDLKTVVAQVIEPAEEEVEEKAPETPEAPEVIGKEGEEEGGEGASEGADDTPSKDRGAATSGKAKGK